MSSKGEHICIHGQVILYTDCAIVLCNPSALFSVTLAGSIAILENFAQTSKRAVHTTQLCTFSLVLIFDCTNCFDQMSASNTQIVATKPQDAKAKVRQETAENRLLEGRDWIPEKGRDSHEAGQGGKRWAREERYGSSSCQVHCSQIANTQLVLTDFWGTYARATHPTTYKTRY